MSKIATFAVSLTLAASDEPEGNQIDLGPYTSNANIGTSNIVAGIAGANTVSPAVWQEVALANSANNVVSSGPYVTPNVFSMFLGILPVTSTSGNLNIAGANTDAGTSISSQNPSFIPVLSSAYGEGILPNGICKVYLSSDTATALKVFWA